MAARLGHSSLAEYLILQGIQVDARNKLLQTALHVATTYGWEGMTELLLKAKADILAKDSHYRQAFHYACCAGSTKLVIFLLQHDNALIQQ